MGATWTATLALVGILVLLAVAVGVAAGFGDFLHQRKHAETFVVADEQQQKKEEQQQQQPPAAHTQQVERIFAALFQRAPTPSEVKRYTAEAAGGDADAITRAVVRDADTIRAGADMASTTTPPSDTAAPNTAAGAVAPAPSPDVETPVHKPIPPDAFSRRFVETTVDGLQSSLDRARKALDELQSEIDTVRKWL